MTDSGPGIPLEHLPHIFDRFYKADPSRASSRGSGLGLAIARENARLLGGELAVTNAPGGGARFVLTLPAGPCTSRPSVTRSLPDCGRSVKSAVKHGHAQVSVRRRRKP